MQGRPISIAALCALALGSLVSTAAAGTKAPAPAKIPITTASAEARALYLEGRDLAEKLRATDAHERYQKAAAADAGFALAHLGLAVTSPTAVEFTAEIRRAVALTDKASDGERLLILATDAGARGDLARRKQLLLELTRKYPGDERGYNQLGLHYFTTQDWAAAVGPFEKAIRINPEFSAPYNQLGYAYRFLEKYAEAEKTFQKYMQLIPGDPNPYDSYAELLMKMGRFDDAIATYRKALAIDPHFVASYVGIGNAQMLQGKGGEARKTFARMDGVARNDGEKRQARFWTAHAYLHEGATDPALAEVDAMLAIASAGKDLANVAADHNFKANILLDAGRIDQAAAEIDAQLEAVDRSSALAETKAQAHRNALFDRARIALARKDVAGARAKAKEYAAKAAAAKVPFELGQTHELAGLIALANRQYTVAVTELRQANAYDPRVLYQLALALDGAGQRAEAQKVAGKAAHYNGLAGNYSLVRKKAMALATRS